MSWVSGFGGLGLLGLSAFCIRVLGFRVRGEGVWGSGFEALGLGSACFVPAAFDSGIGLVGIRVLGFRV